MNTKLLCLYVIDVWVQLTQGEESTDMEAQMRLAIQAITSHVVAFCRAMVARSGVSAQYFCILFGPSLMEALARDQTGDGRAAIM